MDEEVLKRGRSIPEPPSRGERLAEALRANLVRRKAQARARKSQTESCEAANAARVDENPAKERT